MSATIINKFGKVTGWNSITVHMLGRDLEGIMEIAYDDTVDIEGVKGAGMFDVGFGESNYAAKASITVLVEEVRALMSSLAPGQRLQSIPQFPIVVQYEYNGKIYTDTIDQCKIKGPGIDVKQGDKSISVKLELYTPQIKWNTGGGASLPRVSI